MESNESLGSILATLPSPPPARDGFWEDLHKQLALEPKLHGSPVPQAVATSPAMIDVEPRRGHRQGRVRLALLVAATAAVVLLGLVWISSRDGSQPAGPGPNPSATTVVGPRRVNGSISDPHAVDLDPWLSNASPWPEHSAGPYLVFDVNQLPDGWTVDSVSSGNTLQAPMIDGSYSWTAVLRSPDHQQFLATISSIDRSRGPIVDSPSAVVVRGHVGIQSATSIEWHETDTVAATVRSPDQARRQEALDLANALVAVTVDDLSGAPKPEGNIVTAESQPTRLQGVIGRTPWWIGIDAPGSGDIFLYLEGRLSPGSFSTAGATEPPTPSFGVAFIGVQGGVMIMGTTPASVASTRAELSDGTTIGLPVVPRIGGTAFAVPDPDGLDLVAIDFLDTQGTLLHRMLLPTFQHHTIGSVGLSSLPFGNPAGSLVFPTRSAPATSEVAASAPGTTVGSESSVAGASGCRQWTAPLADQPNEPTVFGTALAAKVLSCPAPGNQLSPFVDGPTVWVSGATSENVPTLYQLDSSLQPLAAIQVSENVIAMAPDASTIWAVTSRAGGSAAHLVRVDTVTRKVIDQIALSGTHVADGPVPAASIAIAGDDVWVSIANGPATVAHYRGDGTFVAAVPVPSTPAEVAAIDGHAYVISTTGDIVGIDAATNSTAVLATIAQTSFDNNAHIAVSGSDLWADTTELVHIDLTTGAITARRPAVVYDLAADPHEAGRVWAATFENDPTQIPGVGSGTVVRLASHGVDPDGVVYVDTILSNGINQLSIADDGTVYGENAYASELVRITLGPP